MILKASQRSNGRELAKHLMNAESNEHVNVHDIRGFMASNIRDAFDEAYAISLATRCEQYLFSLSLNPPETEESSIEAFEEAIDMIEHKLGLSKQPRIIVFHEKNARRHCHVVWSRIDDRSMTSIKMSHYKLKLMDVSRDLYLKHGWEMPAGMKKAKNDAPKTPRFSLQEWQQAERLKEDPKILKELFQKCWECSDSRASFAQALEERGYYLAKGDKRGFVAVDVEGKAYSLTRWIDVGSRELKARIGNPETLPNIETAKSFLAERLGNNLRRYMEESKQQAKQIRKPLVQEVRILALSQRKDREDLIQHQQTRWLSETRIRAARLPRGFKGIWHKATGEYDKLRLQNEAEARAGLSRDRKELQALIRSHLLERQELQSTLRAYKEEQKSETLRIKQAIAKYVSTASEPPAPPAVTTPKETFAEQLAKTQSKIALLSGDLSRLQTTLESDLIPDEMRSVIRSMIEKALQTLHMQRAEEKEREERIKDKTREYEEKQALLNQYIRYYTEIELKIEQENRKIEANKQFYELIQNMSYALNGIPRWQINIVTQKPFDEASFGKNLRQYSNQELINQVLNNKHSTELKPEMAAVDLRQGVLGIKEMLRRAGHRPKDTRVPRPEQQSKIKVSANFNSQGRY